MVRRYSKRRSKHALNSIHKSCKLQNNWFKCDRLRKCYKNTYSSICQTLSSPPPPAPRRACAVQRKFRDQEWRHCWHRIAWWKCVFRVSWTLNTNDWNVNCLFEINAQCLSLLFLFFAINCQRKAVRALYFSISLARLAITGRASSK